jgi:hypothetical protein
MELKWQTESINLGRAYQINKQIKYKNRFYSSTINERQNLSLSIKARDFPSGFQFKFNTLNSTALNVAYLLGLQLHHILI